MDRMDAGIGRMDENMSKMEELLSAGIAKIEAMQTQGGYANTEDEVLPYGTYTLREVSTNDSMLHTFKEQTVPVTEHKKTYVVTAENDVVRGGLSVEKRDSITGSTPQGNADFSGITFEIINDSRNPVIVGDKSIDHGEVDTSLTR